jgi:uncharacterized membrane protein YdbT with pleckstrin-like domain
VTTHKISIKAMAVNIIIWMVFIGNILVVSLFAVPILGIILVIIFGMFQYWNYSYSLTIDKNRMTYGFQFISKKSQTIESHQLESVSISQGPFARMLNYGKLTITGTGGKSIKTIPFDDVYQVAEEIRKINPKLSS